MRPEIESSSVDFLSWILPIALLCLLDLCMQERTSEVPAGFSEAVCPLSSLKYPLVILHTPLICLINLFLIDYAKVNFESFALEMTKLPNYEKVPVQYLAHSRHFIK